MMGLPVRVMATSEMDWCRTNCCAIFCVDRAAVAKEAIFVVGGT